MKGFEQPDGATPIEDLDGLRLTGVTTLGDLNAVEAENILEAVRIHLGGRKKLLPGALRDDYVLRVHRDMLGNVWEWAGRFRTSELTIGVAPYLVPADIATLCHDVRSWDIQTEAPLSVVERSARLHHRLTRIHPFRNGNGRHARLMADIYLRAHDHPLPDWPDNIGHKGDTRKSYIEALRSADKGDYSLLVGFTQGLLAR